MFAVVSSLSLDAFLQAFAVLGSFVGGIGAYAAFLSLMRGDQPAEIADATGVGAAIGFLPGVIVAVFVYLQIASQSPGVHAP